MNEWEAFCEVTHMSDVIADAANPDSELRRAEAPKTGRERQRRRDAQLIYDLHDGAAQYLAAAIMELERYKLCLGVRPEAANEALENVQLFLIRSRDEVRGLIHGWHVVDEAKSIADVLQNVVFEFEDRVEIELVFDPALAAPGMELPASLYRIVQESLTNICRHSKSEKARVEVRARDNHLHIAIQDWGVGFDTEALVPGKFGLLGVRHRAISLGGEATVTSALGKGTCVSVRIPLVR
jgi:signal transduction histidine kinase